jgi:hypothetical protein
MLKLVLTFVLVALSATAATADPAEDRVRAVITEWYAELVRLEKGNAYRLTAPGYIDASPHYEYVDTGSAALGPRIFTSLAATALQFEHEITSIRLDPNFAKVRVWEKGFFYASASDETYERAASSLFVLERVDPSDRWLILAHESNRTGIPPTLRTDPLPDLREAWEKQQSRWLGTR